jgi:arylformamidase
VIIDISPRVDARLAVWPGDTLPTREVLLDLARGDAVTLSTLRTSVHAGAHADAPSHYGRDAASIDERPLDLYLGPCRVIRVAARRRQRVTLDDLGGAPLDVPRLLIATGTYPDPARFNDDFAALDASLVDALHAAGVVLVGIDTPSVDLHDDTVLLAHQRFLAHDMAILEHLVLGHVTPGTYDLIALPLRLAGFDASPVRAVLRVRD